MNECPVCFENRNMVEVIKNRKKLKYFYLINPIVKNIYLSLVGSPSYARNKLTKNNNHEHLRAYNCRNLL